MKITIYGKQMSVRESLKALVEKKLAKFDKFFGEDTEAFVTCKVRKGVKIIEITVNYLGNTFRSEDESETFITALDRAVEGLERQIRKNKTRVEKLVKKGAFVIDEDDDDEEEVRKPRFGFLKKKEIVEEEDGDNEEEEETLKEIQPVKPAKTTKTENKAWQSKDFLELDDDMEFEFLDL